MNIYQTINAIMQEIEPIGKDSVNKQQGFKYRGIDAVMNALQPLFAKHKLFCVPEIISRVREDRLNKDGKTLIYSIIHVKYTFYAEDGSNVSTVVVGEGMDTGDKSTNKAMAIAFKYACFQLFCIPTEETVPDPDKESHELKIEKIICDCCGKEIQGQSINGEFRLPDQIKEKCGGLCLACYMQKNKQTEEKKIEEVEVK